MLGYYNYTVILTYCSVASAVIGIFAGLAGEGHPFVATVCLMFCGLFDAFDGMVARKRKQSTDNEKRFGIQIDSLSDLIAFGVLPCAICYALYTSHMNPLSSDVIGILRPFVNLQVPIYVTIFCLYVLAALIRLAFFNVQEENRQKQTSEKRKDYSGLPVTAAAIIFPIVSLIQFIYGKSVDLSPIFALSMVVVGILFLSKITVKKISLRGILLLVALGIVEFGVILFFALNYYA